MIRSGAAEQPEPTHQPFRIIHPLLCVFWTAAQRIALSAATWRLRLRRQWWKELAAELTLDLRPHKKTKQVRKSKTNSRSARHPSPGSFI